MYIDREVKQADMNQIRKIVVIEVQVFQGYTLSRMIVAIVNKILPQFFSPWVAEGTYKPFLYIGRK